MSGCESFVRTKVTTSVVTNAISLPSLHRILDTVAEVTGIEKNRLTGSKASRHIIPERFVYYWIARKHTKKSLRQIAHVVGRIQSGSVLNGVRRVEEQPAKFAPLINAVLERLEEG